jgi:hypothetical protein
VLQTSVCSGSLWKLVDIGLSQGFWPGTSLEINLTIIGHHVGNHLDVGGHKSTLCEFCDYPNSVIRRKKR